MGDPPHVDRVQVAIEGPVQTRDLFPIAQIGRVMGFRANVIHVLRPAQNLKALDHPRRPTGHVARQLFEHGRGALAPAKGDGVRDFGARARDFRHHAVQAPVADQVADVRHDPIAAGFDELIVVKLIEVLFEHARLLGDHRKQLAQRPALLGVARPIDRRQKLVQFLRVEAHAITPN